MVLNPHQRPCLLILEREGKAGGGRNIDVTEKHPSVASQMCPDQRSNRQPRYVSWLGTQPTAFGIQEDAPTEPPAKASVILQTRKV